MNQLQDILKAKREEKKWNKSQMSRELKVSSQLYGQYEKGYKLPGADFFIKWKKAFGQDLTSEIETKDSNEIHNGSVASNKPQQSPQSKNGGIDLIEEVGRLRDEQIRIMATLKVLVSEIGPLIAKENHQSKASAALQLEKDISERIESLKILMGRK